MLLKDKLERTIAFLHILKQRDCLPKDKQVMLSFWGKTCVANNSQKESKNLPQKIGINFYLEKLHQTQTQYNAHQKYCLIWLEQKNYRLLNNDR